MNIYLTYFHGDMWFHIPWGCYKEWSCWDIYIYTRFNIVRNDQSTVYSDYAISCFCQPCVKTIVSLDVSGHFS